MGVSKLTTYMEDKKCGPRAVWDHTSLAHLSERRLVIDGNSLCFWLYHSDKSLPPTVSMGGSYPKFYKLVLQFFETLTDVHKICPIVVFDGMKFDTETSRNRSKHSIVSVSKYQSRVCEGSFGLPPPLMTKEVFLDALQEYGDIVDVHCVDGEADAEIVAIANFFRSPVMSSDSDFYMYKVTGGYIPLNSLNGPELLSPEVDIFSVDRFTEALKLQDEDLRFILPAVFGNDFIKKLASISELPLQCSSDIAGVSDVIRYASMFASFGECLAAAASMTNQALFNNLKKAQQQYQSLPCPSYPQGLPPVAPGGLSSLRPEYREQFQQGCFQRFMAEAIVSGQCIFRTTFDDVKFEGSQSTSLSIRKAIYHILGCESPVVESRRGAETKLDHITVQFNGRPRITVDEIHDPRSSTRHRESILLSVLQCDHEQATRIAELPAQWRLPVAATSYWYTHTKRCRPVTKALVACFVHVASDHPSRPVPRQAAPSRPTQGTPELELVHYLAQWQCVYFDVIALNQLLMEPFQYVSPAKLFDGKVAAQYAFQEIVLRTQGLDTDMYRKLLDTIAPKSPKEKSPPKKLLRAMTSQPRRTDLLY